VRLSEVGEFGLIARLAEALGVPTDPRLLQGIGDDAAVWRNPADRLMVATTDTLVEGVHFDLSTTDWRDLGWKALAENVSDIAAMGCAPRYALVSLALPSEARVEDADALYAGLRACAEAYECAIVGGDTVRCPQVVLNVTVLGESLPLRNDADVPLLLRSAARVGDALAVTGPLGGSGAGLRVLVEAPQVTELTRQLIEVHRRPLPRVRAGQALVAAGCRCGMDISDGLVADVGHIVERSRLSAEIHADLVPVHPAARAVFGDAALDLALTAGEDYELVCAGPPEVLAAASAELAAIGEPPITIIGSIIAVEGERPAVRVLAPDGAPRTIRTGGYAHFAAGDSP
jgi:thiamine-monophosphate kinase